MKVCIVLSTRPEIIKLSSLIQILKKKKINFFIINTNQHFNKMMSRVFFDFFGLPKPKYNIRADSQKKGNFFSKTLKEIEKILLKEKPNKLIVQGDTDTALAGCLGTSIFNRKLMSEDQKVKIIHIESGLRSFDNSMPEEVNRKLIDQLSDILFVPTAFDINNLKKENLIKGKKIYKVGNTISDVIKKCKPFLKKNNILKKEKLKKKNYFLLTLHRPESVDDSRKLKKLILIFEKIGQKFDKQIVFPIHPRTQKIIKKVSIKRLSYLKFLSPLNFIDFVSLMYQSKVVLTDSGGVQEETSLLGIPCITVRSSTERQLSIINKTNILTGYNYKKIINAINYFNKKKLKPSNIFGDGRVSNRIFNTLIKLSNKN